MGLASARPNKHRDTCTCTCVQTVGGREEGREREGGEGGERGGRERGEREGERESKRGRERILMYSTLLYYGGLLPCRHQSIMNTQVIPIMLDTYFKGMYIQTSWLVGIHVHAVCAAQLEGPCLDVLQIHTLCGEI